VVVPDKHLELRVGEALDGELLVVGGIAGRGLDRLGLEEVFVLVERADADLDVRARGEAGGCNEADGGGAGVGAAADDAWDGVLARGAARARVGEALLAAALGLRLVEPRPVGVNRRSSAPSMRMALPLDVGRFWGPASIAGSMTTGSSSCAALALTRPKVFFLRNEAPLEIPPTAAPPTLSGAPATPVTSFPGAAKVPWKVDDPWRERVT